jgi:hypothetical protein
MHIMNFFRGVAFILLFGLSACNNTEKKTPEKPFVQQQTATVLMPDTIKLETLPAKQSDYSNPHIYNFMRMVIRDQKLNKKYGLLVIPEQNCGTYGDDRLNLKQLLIEEKKPEKVAPDTVSSDSIYPGMVFSSGPAIITTVYFGPEKCLTRSDIKFMMAQKGEWTNFKWDNDRLGFDKANKKNYYAFSVPLFSKDRKKAVIKIESLCPGLCGTGNLVAYIKKNGKWKGSTGLPWIH